jgi:actin-related protein
MFGGDDVNALVFDLGSRFTKAGFAGEDLPKCLVQSVISELPSSHPSFDSTIFESKPLSYSHSHLQSQSSSDKKNDPSDMAEAGSDSAENDPLPPSQKSFYSSLFRPRHSFNSHSHQSSSSPSEHRQERRLYCGSSAMVRRDEIPLSPVVKNGLISDWDGAECMFSLSIEKHLHLDPRDHPIMYVEPTIAPLADREKMAQLLFERFECPAIYFGRSGVLSAFSAGKSQACVLEMGAGYTCVSPIMDGYLLSKSVRKSKIGGNILDSALIRAIEQIHRNDSVYLNGTEINADSALQAGHIRPPVSIHYYYRSSH